MAGASDAESASSVQAKNLQRKWELAKFESMVEDAERALNLCAANGGNLDHVWEALDKVDSKMENLSLLERGDRLTWRDAFAGFLQPNKPVQPQTTVAAAPPQKKPKEAWAARIRAQFFDKNGNA